MATNPPPKVLFIVSQQSPRPGEEAVIHRLTCSLGYDVDVKTTKVVSALDTRDKELVVISSLVKDKDFGDEFCDVFIPIIASSKELYVSLRMSGRDTVGVEGQQTEIDINHRKRPGHGMMAEMSGVVKISEEPMEICWATEVPEDSVRIAALRESDKKVLFGCRVATPMFGEKEDPKLFGARRVAFPFDYNKKPTPEDAPIWLLFDQAVHWAVGRTNTRQFDEVFREEWKEVYTRRCKAYGSQNDSTGFNGKNAPDNLVGLSFSGGGIRSATFCLGVLQGLNELKLLRIFDYFSTVSGGGYLGGWWSAWLSRPEGNEGIFPGPEQIEPQRLEKYRWRTGSAKLAEGSLSAGADPIHHLRLFANYLTPRKGSFGADTWRAITVVTRNLLLTWLILVPLLFAVVVAAQSLFVMREGPVPESPQQPAPESEFFHTHWFDLQRTVQERQAERLITDEKALKAFDLATESTLGQLKNKYHGILKQRAYFILLLLAPLMGWIALLIGSYLQSNAGVPIMVRIKDWVFVKDKKNFQFNFGGRRIAHWLGLAGAGVIAFLTLLVIVRPSGGWFSYTVNWLDPRTSRPAPFLILWAIAGLILIFFTMPWRRLEQDVDVGKTEEELRRGVWRNRITGWHARLLIFCFLFATVLVFAAYGHEVFDYLLRDATPRTAFLAYVTKIGGWGTFIATIFGVIFSALKSAPSGGHDSGEVKPPPTWQKAIFAITPLFVVISLLIFTAWSAHEISRSLRDMNGYPSAFRAIIIVGILLALFYALFEIRWDKTTLAYVALFLITLVVIVLAVFLYNSSLPQNFSNSDHIRMVQFAVAIGGILFLRFLIKGDRWSGNVKRFSMRLRPQGKPPSEFRLKVVLWLVFWALLVVSGWFSANYLDSTMNAHSTLALFALSSIALCFCYVIIESLLAKGDNLRSISVLAAVYVVSFILLLVSFHSDSVSKLPFISLSLFAGTLAWVIALGWMADPNAISMHGFYKSRLVRAYLGASNPKRLKDLYEITETVVGDDVLLNDMKNCERGAPYHLINTTLNLAGGRDLATAQRSSAMFVLSKLYCGSFRTGFQRSKGYMNGGLTLGTAVATSGAAVSPGMGAGKTTSSQTMLMTLLNLRLGFWAPTPSGENWDSPYARLWPFYLLRESFSQTNDLSSYCYLTDGGHFDNLGLYSLVERGCRFIVMVDAVADPQPCFSDLGAAIRRCRIDFHAEIDLDITPFIKSKDHQFAQQHYAVGTIVYSEKHVKRLGWKNMTLEDRTGIVIYIKSSLLKNEKVLRADVRQYGIENSEFPQQSTIDQWFDEAQFESYRQLGKHSVLSVFDKIKKEPPNQKREEKPFVRSLEALLSWPFCNQSELEKENKRLDDFDNQPLSPDLIERLFESTSRNAGS